MPCIALPSQPIINDGAAQAAPAGGAAGSGNQDISSTEQGNRGANLLKATARASILAEERMHSGERINLLHTCQVEPRSGRLSRRVWVCVSVRVCLCVCVCGGGGGRGGGRGGG